MRPSTLQLNLAFDTAHTILDVKYGDRFVGCLLHDMYGKFAVNANVKPYTIIADGVSLNAALTALATFMNTHDYLAFC